MAGGGAMPVKAVSEATRERETFKYSPFLFADVHFTRDGHLPPSSELVTAPDCVLTALAQLGTYQTCTERAFVSLFDSSHQYFVAEATPSIRAVPNLPSDSCPVPLSLRGIAIPRNQGTCDHVLYLPASRSGEDLPELPLSLVPNLAADARFSSRPYCDFGEAGQFYASVPIRTRRGIDIGAYCVMNTTPPDAWDGQCAQRLRDVSHAIMEHLEFKRTRHMSRQHERMNRGLGSFIEGKGTLTGWQSGGNVDAFMDNAKVEGALNAKQQHLERHEQESKEEGNQPSLQAVWPTSRSGDANVSRSDTSTEWPARFNPKHKTSARRAVDPFSVVPEPPKPDESPTGHIFSKAANVIREAFEVEGCVFLDVTLGSYRPPPPSRPGETVNVDEFARQTSLTSSSDEQSQPSLGEAPDAICDLLGFSATDASSINNPASMNGSVGVMPKRFLAKLLRRYPNGHIFNFDAIGELQSSDSSGDDGKLKIPPPGVESAQANASADGSTSRSSQKAQRDKKYSRVKEGALIHQAFPFARSVAFVPVWDSKRERWFAGGFIYTLIPTRVFSVEGELSFLVAFAKLVAAEVLNLETLQADKAKSDALGSLSHELRSPLHGIILSTELLNDTNLSVFQGNAAHTIETCCRTLLDTIEHLLDYSKVNSFAAKEQQGHGRSSRGKRARSDQFGKKTLYKHKRLDGLVEEVVDCVFAGFNFQRMSVLQFSKQNKAGHTDIGAHNRLDSEQAIEQLGLSPDNLAVQREQLGATSVYVSVDPTCNWMFHLAPGALRRIVMNLLGNSLKYTASGTIRVSLTQEVSRRSAAERLVKLTVYDTGKGMSEDFLRHKLFRPFSQQDDLTPGTGLGLSLVKTITSQLRGHISVDSQIGIGTTVTVTLPLEQSLQACKIPVALPEDDRLFEEQIRELRGLRVRVSGFASQWSGDGLALVEDICRRWLQVDLVSDQEMAPDIVLRSEDVMPRSPAHIYRLAKTPNVVVCRDALAAYRLVTAYENVGQGRIFEFISQPIGPRALARSMVLAYKRWAGLPRNLPALRPPSRARSPHAGELPIVDTVADSLPSEMPHLQVEETSRYCSPDADVEAASASPTELAFRHTIHDDESDPGAELKRNSRLLLVDDNQINLKVLSAYMTKLGLAHEAVMNGKEAVDAYTEYPGEYAGILMDISMPVMDGLEATRRIRAHERGGRLRAVAILALTGLSSHSTHQEALESGVDLFLTKPVRLKALGAALGSMGLMLLPQTDVEEL